MRHRKAGLKLNRTSSHRAAMFRNMVTSLFKHDRIRTTDAKAKELRRWSDHLITLAKRGDLHARRQALAIIREKDVVHKLFDEAQKRYGAIKGGYTRVLKLGRRAGDAAQLSLVELAETEKATKAKKKKKQTKAESTPKPAVTAAETTPQAEAEGEEAATATSTDVQDAEIAAEPATDQPTADASVQTEDIAADDADSATEKDSDSEAATEQ